jgi:hypothetical protein
LVILTSTFSNLPSGYKEPDHAGAARGCAARIRHTFSGSARYTLPFDRNLWSHQAALSAQPARMNLEYSNNVFILGPRPKRVFRPPLVRDDPRPRCALVLGDGFTQSCLRHYHLDTAAPSSVRRHFPAPDDKLYVPVTGDLFGPSALWDARKWPRLFAAWHTYGRLDDPYGFYQACARERISSSVARGTWSFSTDTLAYELRAYLWHFFRSFQRTIDRHLVGHCVSEPGAWLWGRLLKLLNMDFRLSLVTFNYDLLVPRVLGAVIGRRIVGAVERPDPPFDEWPKTCVPLLLVHGGINQFLDFPPDFRRGPANPWLHFIRLRGNLSDQSITIFRESYDPDFDYFPLAPALVPPGHQGDDICNPHSRVQEMAKELLAVADVVIFCGLSAREPDTLEIQGLVNAVQPKAQTVQVGVAGVDESNDLARLMQASPAGRSAFLDAGELTRLRGHLGSRFSLTSDQWDRLCV